MDAMRYVLVFMLIAFSNSLLAQNLNDYKYVLVSNQYEFQRDANRFYLNDFLVFELKKKNFTAFKNTDVVPIDMNVGYCNTLQLDVKKSGTLRVYMVLTLRDCKDQIVFESKRGVGRTKDNKKAYFEAIRDAMTSFEGLNYKYVQREESTPIVIMEDAANKKLDAKIKLNKNESTVTSTSANASIKLRDTLSVMHGGSISGKRIRNKENTLDNTVASTVNNSAKLQSMHLDAVVYTDATDVYGIVERPELISIYKDALKIGMLKPSASGSFLVLTSDFTGLAYKKGNQFIIEAVENGEEIKLLFTIKK